MLIRLILIFAILSFSLKVNSQGLDNIWLMGYDTQASPPWGALSINFSSGAPIIDTSYREMELNNTHSNISDTLGSLLFYTNGIYVADAMHDTMLNGSGLNPSQYTTSMFNNGLNIGQGNIIIPLPDSDSIYYLFHQTVDSFGTSSYLYLTIIDMSVNGGLGGVISKNQIIINDGLNAGRINALKHANGRDWWVFCHKFNTNTYYKLLITPIGIDTILTQNIGIIRPPDGGWAVFSKDGSKFAYHWTEHGAELFDFDRCTGMFSNPLLLNNGVGIGVEFSDNSEVLYVSGGDTLLQYDLTATDIKASETIVALWDSFYSPFPPFATVFCFMKLAPDGKIYITTCNSTLVMHTIEHPDSIGLACDVQQHSVNLNRYYFNTLPNHPNYHLGPLVGSVCDTVYTGIPPPEERLTLKLYPNPNSGTFQITYTPLPENLTLQVFNILGEKVHSQLLPQWSQLQNIHIGNLPAGVYMATITSSASKKSIKFLVE